MSSRAAGTPLATLAAAALLGLWAAGATAQDINPDRPDLTTSAEVVPAGALQIETGLEYERARVGGGPTARQLSAQGVLRLGLTRALEQTDAQLGESRRHAAEEQRKEQDKRGAGNNDRKDGKRKPDDDDRKDGKRKPDDDDRKDGDRGRGHRR